MKHVFNKTLLALTVFAIAMGFLETAVVVYLRELLYPHGFELPLTPMKPLVIVTELLREAATIIMLAMVGYFTGKSFVQRFGNFLFCFAVWDIFYYIFLLLLLGWPQSFQTWDILFLIPIPWVGPVGAPVLVSLTLICWNFLLQHHNSKITWHAWSAFFTGAMVIIGSFTFDYWKAIFRGEDIIRFSNVYIPTTYAWWLFLIGLGFLLMALYAYHTHSIKLKSTVIKHSTNDQIHGSYNNVQVEDTQQRV